MTLQNINRELLLLQRITIIHTIKHIHLFRVEASAGETMKKYYKQFTELHAKLLKTEHELSEAKK